MPAPPRVHPLASKDRVQGARFTSGSTAGSPELPAAHGIPYDEAVFVGDSLADGDFARAAGIRFIGLQRIFSAAEFGTRGLGSARDLAALTHLWTSGQAFAPGPRKPATAGAPLTAGRSRPPA